MKFKFCSSCGFEKAESDFLHFDTCYKCVLHEKQKKIGHENPKPKTCGICGSKVPKNRWVYCSEECGEIAEMKRQKNYWMRNIN
jgi:hypothetical protein